MEQKQSENEEYIVRKKAEIAKLEKKQVELKPRLQELQLETEEKKAKHLKSEIADMKKLIISNQKSAEESIAALVGQMQVKYVDIGKKMDSFQTVIEQTALLTTNDVNARISNVQDDLINISTKLETLKRTLMKDVEWKDDGKPTILVLGGRKSNKMHLLNRDRTQWSTLPLKMPTALESGGAVYLDEEIYIFGGWGSSKTYKLNQEMKWIQLADMNEERRNISNSSVVFDGCIWVFGGYNDAEKHLNSVEKYIPEENKWIQMPSMTEKRDHTAAADCKGKLFVSGGYYGKPSFLKVSIHMECFDPVSQKWTMFLDLPSPMVRHTMIPDGTCLTILGEGGENKSVWLINPNDENATWKKLPPMRKSRRQFTASLLGDNIFAIGAGGWSNKVEVFNGGTWEDGPKLPAQMYYMCSIVIPAHLAGVLSSHR